MAPQSSAQLPITQVQELKNNGKHEEAISMCQKLICEDLNYQEAYEELADNYMNLRQYDQATVALKQALNINPNSANAHYLLGFSYSATSDWNKSIIHLERANKLEINHAEILRCLGWSLFHGKSKAQGLCVLKRAYNIAPKDTFILSDLGMCYLSLRNFTAAEKTFSTIIELDPENVRAKECLEACQYFLAKKKR